MPAAEGAVQQAPAGGQVAGPGAGGTPAQNIWGTILRLGLMYSFMMWMRGGKKNDSTQPLMRPLVPRGHNLTADFYVSSQPGTFGTHVWSVPTVTLPSVDARASVELDSNVLASVRWPHCCCAPPAGLWMPPRTVTTSALLF